VIGDHFKHVESAAKWNAADAIASVIRPRTRRARSLACKRGARHSELTGMPPAKDRRPFLLGRFKVNRIGMFLKVLGYLAPSVLCGPRWRASALGQRGRTHERKGLFFVVHNPDVNESTLTRIAIVRRRTNRLCSPATSDDRRLNRSARLHLDLDAKTDLYARGFDLAVRRRGAPARVRKRNGGSRGNPILSKTSRSD